MHSGQANLVQGRQMAPEEVDRLRVNEYADGLPAAAAERIVADLVESVIKRRANLKDSGAAIPGIGGMFDLSDSIILVAPVGYLLFRLP